MKTIKLDYEGEEALLLCQGLKRNGYSVNESRIFTQEMKESVVEFQRMLMGSWDTVPGNPCFLQDVPLLNV